MKQLTQDEATQVEDIIDRVGLSTFLQAISLICSEKAEHLRSNWQDPTSARHWDALSNHLDTVSRAALVKFGA